MDQAVCRRLEGKVAVVTGGAGGIGLATVRRLASECARIVVADVIPVAGQDAADEVDGLFVQTDVARQADVANLYQAAADAYGRVDIAFNNARAISASPRLSRRRERSGPLRPPSSTRMRR